MSTRPTLKSTNARIDALIARINALEAQQTQPSKPAQPSLDGMECAIDRRKLKTGVYGSYYNCRLAENASPDTVTLENLQRVLNTPLKEVYVTGVDRNNRTWINAIPADHA